MATSKPHHLTKKELRQPVEIVNIVDSVADYISDHLAKVVGGVIGLLVLVLLAVAIRFHLNAEKREVAEKFYQAERAYDKHDYGGARLQFAELARSHAGSSLGRLAQFYLGNAYLTDKQPAKAREALQKYLDKNDRPAFREMALMQLGIANEELSDFSGAKRAYAEAAAMKGPERGRAELNVARLLAKAGKKKGAIDAYQRYLTENPYSQERGRVVDALAELGVPPATSVSAKTIEVPGK